MSVIERTGASDMRSEEDEEENLHIVGSYVLKLVCSARYFGGCARRCSVTGAVSRPLNQVSVGISMLLLAVL
jgi:hypothetical protein